MPDDDQPLPSFRSLASLHLHPTARAVERFSEAFYKREFGMKLAECRVINALHGQGLVDKTWSQVDQRSVSLSLTGAGRALHRRIHAAAAEINRQWLAVIPAAERAALLRNLEETVSEPVATS